MEKLTIEQKAKRYDESLNRAKEIHRNEYEKRRDMEWLFPELKEKTDKDMIQKLITVVHLYYGEGVDAERDECLKWLKKQNNKLQGKSALEAIKEEKIDNANKVEPKFKVGDWLQYRNAKPFYVEGITSQGYVNGISCLPFSWEDEIHLWSIADTQAGDVLVASDGSIFLFAGVVDCACKYYVSLTTGNYVKINKEVKGGYWETSRAVHPATKEQCALLFQKMREEGYEWDSEKKKSKKIMESNETN